MKPQLPSKRNDNHEQTDKLKPKYCEPPTKAELERMREEYIRSMTDYNDDGRTIGAVMGTIFWILVLLEGIFLDDISILTYLAPVCIACFILILLDYY